MYNQAQNKATQKYQKEHLEEVRMWVKKGEKDRYKQLATADGKSLAEFIRTAIDEYAYNHGL